MPGVFDTQKASPRIGTFPKLYSVFSHNQDRGNIVVDTPK